MNTILEKSLDRTKVSVYYNGKVLEGLAEDLIKEETKIEVKIEIDFYDIQEYGSYSLTLANEGDLSEKEVSIISDKYGDVNVLPEFIGGIFDKLFHGYAISPGSAYEFVGEYYENGYDMPIPVIFNIADYLNIKDDCKASPSEIEDWLGRRIS